MPADASGGAAHLLEQLAEDSGRHVDDEQHQHQAVDRRVERIDLVADADPQALQLLQGNFPAGTMITLTPWDPREVWFLLSAALARKPAVIAMFVTRPNETVPDRARPRQGGSTCN